MSAIIWNPIDLEYYGGLDLGWTTQLRLAKIFRTGSTATKLIKQWMLQGNLGASGYQVLPVYWKIRDQEGKYICSRPSLLECQKLIAKYLYSGLNGWSFGPYKIFRVTRRPKLDILTTSC